MKKATRKSAPLSQASTPVDPAAVASRSAGDSDSQHGCPVVGIGASAGGLEALVEFFLNAPTDTGLAFVVVQHLDPGHEGMLPELLQRRTAMPVSRIHDGMPTAPNRVYVIPPNYGLTISQGLLRLTEYPPDVGLRQPIDIFLSSLAEDLEERSVGVILSGMGTDGTAGMQAIRSHGGVGFVQDPKTAKYDSMIQSVISNGLADVVAPATELPGRIMDWLQRNPLPPVAEDPTASDPAPGLGKILALLRRQIGHDFAAYKRSTIQRRIERRMAIHRFVRIDDYVRHLRGNPQEVEFLFKEMLIGLTSFFRDRELWDELRDQLIPELLRQRPEGGELRAWVAACSTGEEAYSLAMVFQEALEKEQPKKRITLRIFATDLDQDAINRARTGIFPRSIAKDVSKERLQRFFVSEDGGFRIVREIREMVVFTRHSIVAEAPFNRLDLLSCRNLLIYLVGDLQRKLLPLFHYCIKSSGFLILGNTETIGSATDLFVPAGGRARIFRRLDHSPPPGRMHFPLDFHELTPSGFAATGPALASPSGVTDIQALASDFLLRTCTPAAVLTSGAGDILFIHGKAGTYLEPAAGKANWNLFAMAREDLSHVLFEAFQRALRKNEPVEIKGIEVATPDKPRAVDLCVHPLKEPTGLQGMVMVVFTEQPAAPPTELKGEIGGDDARAGHLTALTRQLRGAREELRVLREEMQTTGEELRASNEELQSANEELQSMNEELTTSKEEMQSMNDELQLVSQNLIIKFETVSRTNNDMKNLLSSTDVATLSLDNDLNVRWFAPQIDEIIRLIPSDIGRPVTDLVSRLDYPTLAADMRSVLQTLVPMRKEIPSNDGRWFAVRIIPYQTKESAIDGLVLTFLDITESRNVADKLRALEARPLPQPSPPETPRLESR